LLSQVYPRQRPVTFQYGTLARVEVFRHPSEHWHYVTYGLSELEHKQTCDPEWSGFGFELSYRLKSDSHRAPSWPARLLDTLAEYVFDTGNRFELGDTMNIVELMAAAQPTRLSSAIFTCDPVLDWVETANGRLQFVQVVGLTSDELETCRTWQSERFLDVLGAHNPLLVADLNRWSILSDPDVAADVAAAVERDGSSQASLLVDECSVSQHPGGDWQIRLSVDAVRMLPRMWLHRFRHGRPFAVVGPSASVQFTPGELVTVSGEPSRMEVCLSARVAEKLQQALPPEAGTYRLDVLPEIVFMVV
jgi:hypothetical protein